MGNVTKPHTSQLKVMSKPWARFFSKTPNPFWSSVWSPENWGNASFWSQDKDDTLLRGAAQLNSKFPKWNCSNLSSSWKINNMWLSQLSSQMLKQSKQFSSTNFWRHHCLQTLFLSFKFVASETIEQLTNQCASGCKFISIGDVSVGIAIWKSPFSQRKLQGTRQIVVRINNHDDDDNNGNLKKAMGTV